MQVKTRGHIFGVFKERWGILANLIWPLLIIGFTIFSTPFWDSFVVNARYIISGGDSRLDSLVVVKVDEFARLQHNITDETPRGYIADIVNRAVEYGARVIALNYLFTTADSGYAGHTQLLAALKRAESRGVVIVVPEILAFNQGSSIPSDAFKRFVRTGFSPFISEDIYSTRYIFRRQEYIAPSFAYTTVAFSKNKAPVGDNAEIVWYRSLPELLGKDAIDPGKDYYLDFVPTDERSFNTVSSEAFLYGSATTREDISGRTVLVGSTYLGEDVKDVFVTPHGLLRSTDLQALAIRSLWNGYLLEVPSFSEKLLWVVLALGGIIFIYWHSTTKAMWLSIGGLFILIMVGAILFLSGVKAIPVQAPVLIGGVAILICNYVPFPGDRVQSITRLEEMKKR